VLKRTFVLIVLTAALAGCGRTTSNPVSTADTTPARTTTATGPIVTGAPQALVVTVLDDEGPFFNLVVEAVAPNGVAQPVATIHDVHPAAWEEASPRLDEPILASTAGDLLVSVERGGGGEPGFEAALLLDLNSPTKPPIELPAVIDRGAWGPTDELAVFGQDDLTVIHPKTGTTTRIDIPTRVDPLIAWAADGSGWLATEQEGDDDQRSGTLLRNGTFQPTVARTYGATGRERVMGSKGEIVSEAVSDGATESETALVDFGPGICPGCIVWASHVEPSDDPTFGDYTWDAAGTGLWLVRGAADGKTRWLAHLPAPKDEDRILDLPARADLTIVGIAPDDRWLVFATDDGKRLLVADTANGTTRQLARTAGEGANVVFAGWSQVPAD
jgi:hypothetical protein